MPRRDAAAKAAHLLTSGAVTVVFCHGDHVHIAVQGRTGTRYCGHDPQRGWWCSCPAGTGECSHVRAAMLVTSRRPPHKRRPWARGIPGKR